ncbi:MAG: precorrin-6A reductase [Spirochaetaceae bacterium]|jgi:precorrin-6x reductase|nr:precorrin-6A reductase [Spirochaetaceae bacterium]
MTRYYGEKKTRTEESKMKEVMTDIMASKKTRTEESKMREVMIDIMASKKTRTEESKMQEVMTDIMARKKTRTEESKMREVMTDIMASKKIIFGGTTEGRLIAEWCSAHKRAAIYCVATETGALSLPLITTLVGRLDGGGIRALLLRERPMLVIDATHPYALEASENIKAACAETGTERIRITREGGCTTGCRLFSSGEELISHLSRREGIIFAATGMKEAPLFTKLDNFAERVYFRMLPSIEGLKLCLELGFKPSHLILMWGPFSRELNRAMFSAVGASILVTKESGAVGGFAEKIGAAEDLGLEIALLARPLEEAGVSLGEALERLNVLHHSVMERAGKIHVK